MPDTPEKRTLHIQVHREAQRRLEFGSALIDAVNAGDLQAVKDVLSHAPSDSINFKGTDGNTALHLVTNKEILLRLLDEGPDLTITNDAGKTAVEVQRDAQLTTILENARRGLLGPIPQGTVELGLVSLKI